MAWLDYVYLVYFVMQPPIILLVDTVPLIYPSHWYIPPSSPLHFLQQLRSFYASQFGDQFFAAARPEPWFEMFGWMELLAHLPIATWAVWFLSTRGGKETGKATGATRKGPKEVGMGGTNRPVVGLGGTAELVLLCYGLQTAVTTITCIFQVLHWDEPTDAADSTAGSEGDGGIVGLTTTEEQKMMLVCGLYGPYFALPLVMFFDMFGRLVKRIEGVEREEWYWKKTD